MILYILCIFRAARCGWASPVGSEGSWHWWAGVGLPRACTGLFLTICNSKWFSSIFQFSWRNRCSFTIKHSIFLNSFNFNLFFHSCNDPSCLLCFSLCSSTMPSNYQLGVSTTSALIITASAASFPKTWRPCLQVQTPSLSLPWLFASLKTLSHMQLSPPKNSYRFCFAVLVRTKTYFSGLSSLLSSCSIVYT